MEQKQRHTLFFNGLNELRALAALAVVFHHLELFKHREGRFSLYDIPYLKPFISNLGHNGVLCFFVLSGFLITYLLLAEKQRFNQINIKAFYIRRMLRIWPLFFLVVAVSFFVLPPVGAFPFFSDQQHYPQLMAELDYSTLLFFVFFLSNLALVFAKPVAGAAQTWSVSVEEQFYLVWPWLVKFTRNNKQLFVLILLVLIGKLALNEGLPYVLGSRFRLSQILVWIPIEYMCIGALGAIAFFGQHLQKRDAVLNHPLTKISGMLLLAVELFWFSHGPVLGILFFYFIYVLVTNTYRNALLDGLGKISYGIYMYHPIFLFLLFSVSSHISGNAWLFNLTFYVGVLGSTVGVAFLSYRYFELFFLNLKHTFTYVKSGG